MAATLPHTWYANYGNGSSTGYFAISAWHQPWTPTAGTFTRQTAPTAGNERVFVCIVSGAVGAVEPTWTVTKGAKTTDSSATWMECTGQPGINGDVSNTPASSTERSQAVSLGLIIKKNTADYLFICTTAGTCGAGEPSYNTTTGATTADNTATWTCLGAVGSFTAWSAPFSRLSNAIANTWMAAGDTCYVSSAHAETNSSTITITAPGSTTPANLCSFICVANAPSLPPVAADITTGASVSTTGTGAAITLNGTSYYNGIAFNCGTSSSAQQISLSSATNNAWIRLDNCQLNSGGSGAQLIFLGTVSTGKCKTILDNTTMQFSGATASGIGLGGHVVWRNTPSAISKLGTNWPTTMFVGGSDAGDFLFENVDLSSFGGTQLFLGTNTAGRYVFKDCKLASITAAGLGQPTTSMSDPEADFINCDTGGNVYQHARTWYQGSHVVSTSAVRTGGASDGTTAYSWAVVTTANSSWLGPFECMPICIWNSTTGSTRTITIEAAYVGTSLPNIDDIWIDINYYGTSSSTCGSQKTTTKATILSSTSGWSASTALWGGSAAARQNNHAYVLGDLIGVSSASSIVRLFQCTTAGTSAGSLPGAYATAVDGSQVTDNTAVFTAVERFQLVGTTNTVQAAGMITVYVRAAKVSSTFYVDPVITLS